jgi:uncharacterized protein YegP (UPF0339 family)
MSFELKRSAGKFVFNLKGEAQETLLTSQPFPKKMDALAAIEAAKKRSSDQRAFELRRSVTGNPFFVLKSDRDEELGRSGLFGSEGAAWRAMEAARKATPKAEVRDWC